MYMYIYIPLASVSRSLVGLGHDTHAPADYYDQRRRERINLDFVRLITYV